MQTFNLQIEFKKIVETKQFIQVHLHDTPNEFKVAYIIGVSDGYLALAEINDSGVLDGVTVLRSDMVETIKVATIYLSELMKKIDRNSLDKQVAESIRRIKKFSFEGFVSGLENTNTIVEILYENGYILTGRIIGHSDESLVLDEYRSECDRLFARCYINFEAIAQISFNIPYLEILSQSLADKKL